VFPRNSIGHRDLLAEYGFTCYRGLAPARRYEGTTARQVGKLVTYGLGTTAPPIVTPKTDEFGLVNVPASLCLFSFEGVARTLVKTVSTDPVVRQIKLGLERLRDERDGVFHIWFHPNNITSERDRDQIRK